LKEEILPSTLRKLFDQLAEGILVIDSRCRILYSNPRSWQVIGCGQEALDHKNIGSIFKQLELLVDDKQLLHFTIEKYVQQSKQITDAKVVYETTHSTSGSFALSLFPLNFENQQDTLWIVSLLDISELVKAKLHQTRFVRVIGHELKHPLSSLKAYLYMIRKKMSNVSEKTQEYLEKAETQIDLLTAMLNDLTDLSKISLQQFDVDPTKQLIEPIINQILADFYHLYEDRVIKLKMDEQVKAKVDSIRFRQVLVNIVTNAIRHSDTTSPITIKVVNKDGFVVITVSDKGQGISSEDIPHVFDPYYRTKEGYQHKGLGLGLYIAREIMKRHGGDISIQSTRGKGTVVTLRFPN
jgi:signal transduction histidine kinase